RSLVVALHVRLQHDGAGNLLRAFPHPALDAIVFVGDGDLRALSTQGLGDGEGDAAPVGNAENDGVLPFQQSHALPPAFLCTRSQGTTNSASIGHERASSSGSPRARDRG